MLDLCCFGFISSLSILQVDDYPQANSGTSVLSIFGGLSADAPIMTLLSSHLGLKVGLVSNKVGDDIAGKQLTRLLSNFAVQSTVINQEDLSTPQTIVVSDNQGHRTWFSSIPKVADDLSSADLEMFTFSKLVYIDLYKVINEASLRAISFAKQYKIPLFINLGGDPLTEKAAALLQGASVEVIQTSLDEFSTDLPENYAHEIYDQINPKVVLVTLAKQGVVCVSNSSVIRVPSYEFTTIHSNGAGAAFSAGFAYSYLQGWDLIKAMRFASALGGMYCTVADGYGKFTADDILEFIQQTANE